MGYYFAGGIVGKNEHLRSQNQHGGGGDCEDEQGPARRGGGGCPGGSRLALGSSSAGAGGEVRHLGFEKPTTAAPEREMRAARSASATAASRSRSRRRRGGDADPDEVLRLRSQNLELKRRLAALRKAKRSDVKIVKAPTQPRAPPARSKRKTTRLKSALKYAKPPPPVNTNTHTQADMDELYAQIRVLEEEKFSLNQVLAARDRTIQDASSELTRLTSENKDLKDVLASERAENAAAHKAFEARMDETENRLDELTAINHSLRQKLLGVGQPMAPGSPLLGGGFRHGFSSTSSTPIRGGGSSSSSPAAAAAAAAATPPKPRQFHFNGDQLESNPGYFEIAQKSEATMRGTIESLREAQKSIRSTVADMNRDLMASASPAGSPARAWSTAYANSGSSSSTAADSIAKTRAEAEDRWRKHAKKTYIRTVGGGRRATSAAGSDEDEDEDDDDDDDDDDGDGGGASKSKSNGRGFFSYEQGLEAARAVSSRKGELLGVLGQLNQRAQQEN